MFELTRSEINKLADAVNFNRNTTEKVLRLYSILKYFDECELGQCLTLKGGTAINLFLLDLPRLSVDIDFDFALPLDRQEMLEKRKEIDFLIKSFMADEGYFLSERSKFVHTLDSYVYSYISSSGAIDILKIEINYSDRVHVLKSIRNESTNKLGQTISIRRLDDNELIGSKINALLCRTTPRDVYDVYSLYVNGNIKKRALIRKIAIFYVCLGSEIPIDFNNIVFDAIKSIKELTFQKIKESLIPVLHKGVVFNLNKVKECVSDFLFDFFKLDVNDRLFIEEFNQKTFVPKTLFDGFDVEDLENHPMAIWKIKR